MQQTPRRKSVPASPSNLHGSRPVVPPTHLTPINGPIGSFGQPPVPSISRRASAREQDVEKREKEEDRERAPPVDNGVAGSTLYNTRLDNTSAPHMPATSSQDRPRVSVSASFGSSQPPPRARSVRQPNSAIAPTPTSEKTLIDPEFVRLPSLPAPGTVSPIAGSQADSEPSNENESTQLNDNLSSTSLAKIPRLRVGLVGQSTVELQWGPPGTKLKQSPQASECPLPPNFAYQLSRTEPTAVTTPVNSDTGLSFNSDADSSSISRTDTSDNLGDVSQPSFDTNPPSLPNTLSTSSDPHSAWLTIYTGRASFFLASGLLPGTVYSFRLRVRGPPGETTDGWKIGITGLAEGESEIEVAVGASQPANSRLADQLCTAVAEGDLRLAQELASVMGDTFDTEIRDRYGRTLLMSSCHLGKEDVARWLLDSGASPIAASKSGKSPLMLAATSLHLPLVRLLLRHPSCSAIRGDLLQHTDNAGSTPLNCALENAGENVQGKDIVEEMLNCGADVAREDRRGYTPLDRFLSSPVCSPVVLQTLLRRGAKPTDKCGQGKTYTSLMIACLAATATASDGKHMGVIIPLPGGYALRRHDRACKILLDAPTRGGGGVSPFSMTEHGLDAAAMAEAQGKTRCAELVRRYAVQAREREAAERSKEKAEREREKGGRNLFAS
ncbi:ankyrin [Gonapodya prolifera JEL478]|uniref:Ankyrin n=1 Tax=Gonapodya prolifera (strain JEL478) TaxID=1344416 RepID=A0A139AZK4_GONPJ|nr:ankyrin [Gonapodya prolifera JEL478]|eukprot:KXS22137.1 ankyrin [Gonapodya prolifera JEL478]